MNQLFTQEQIEWIKSVYLSTLRGRFARSQISLDLLEEFIEKLRTVGEENVYVSCRGFCLGYEPGLRRFIIGPTGDIGDFWYWPSVKISKTIWDHPVMPST